MSAGKPLGPRLCLGSVELIPGTREPGGLAAPASDVFVSVSNVLSHDLPDTGRSVCAPVYQCVRMHVSVCAPVCMYTHTCVHVYDHTLGAAGQGV